MFGTSLPAGTLTGVVVAFVLVIVVVGIFRTSKHGISEEGDD